MGEATGSGGARGGVGPQAKPCAARRLRSSRVFPASGSDYRLEFRGPGWTLEGMSAKAPWRGKPS